MGHLHLVRHGQASFGAEDYDRLSPLGELQSRALGRWMKSCRLAAGHVVTGRMRRHRQTAEACLASLGLAEGERPDLTVDGGFDEFDHLEVMRRYSPDLTPASFARTETAADPQQVFRAACERWLSGRHDEDYAESWIAFRVRCEAALARALETSAGRPGVTWVFTSGGVISALAQGLLGIPDDRALELNSVLVNTGITTLWHRPGQVSLARLNQYAHLEASGCRLTRW